MRKNDVKQSFFFGVRRKMRMVQSNSKPKRKHHKHNHNHTRSLLMNYDVKEQQPEQKKYKIV